jgi:hypothetical protein
VDPATLLVLYTTGFHPPAENPIDERRRWHKADNAWHDVKKQGGVAMPSAANEGYDDSYALLSGFPPDVSVQATVRRAPNADCSCAHDVELLLRMEDGSDYVRGYEVYFSCTASSPRAAIVKWNGAMGDFVEIGTSSTINLKTGDVVSATIQGNHITAYLNGVLVAEATDSKWSDGQPGIGFYRRSCGANGDLTLTNYIAKNVSGFAADQYSDAGAADGVLVEADGEAVHSGVAELTHRPSSR